MNAVKVPQMAVDAGYTRLTFFDDFDDPSTIDWEVSGAEGYRWYLDRPFRWTPLEKGDVTVRDSVVMVAQKKSCANWGIATYSAKGDCGTAFRYGYFEARIRFDQTKCKSDVSGFPAWWSFSVAHTTDRNDAHWAELDFFEAMTNPQADGRYTGTFVATAHDWIRPAGGNPQNHQNPNNWHDGVVTEGWHDYGCLWQPGSFAWYYDGRCIAKVTYGDGKPDPVSPSSDFDGCYRGIDEENMLLILGSCAEWPMEIDHVCVWQAK